MTVNKIDTNVDDSIQYLINSYAAWFKKELSIKNIDSYKILSTPFLDRNNDNIQVYISVKNDEIKISDDSWVINNLEMSNMALTPKRKEEIDRICLQHGVQQVENELSITTSKKNYPQSIHRFIQSLLEIDDLYLSAQNRVSTFFYEDVRALLDKKEIFYTPDVQFSGKSTFIYMYDFLFQKNKINPERLCKVLNNATRQNVSQYIFMWEDTKINRSSDARFIVIINDENRITSTSIDAFNEYGIMPIMWSKLPKDVSPLL
jgi:hypothetical protein